MPDGLDADRAAGLTVTYGTSYYALKDRGALKRGETLAVLGASGGVGLAAVELGKLMGARVIACASSDDKIAFARKHGADDGVNYASGDLRDGLRKLGGEHGIDVVYDPVGDRFAEPALRSLAWYGRYLVVGFAAGEIPKIPLNLVLLKCCDVRGVFWGSWTERDPLRIAPTWPRSCAGAPRESSVRTSTRFYPLADAAQGVEGHRRAQGDGQGGAEALTLVGAGRLAAEPRHRLFRGVAVLGLDVVPDELDAPLRSRPRRR